MSLATVASVIGIGAGGLSIYNGLKGGGGGGGGGGSTYVPTGSGAADQTWQDLLKQLQGGNSAAYGAMSPEIMASFQKLLGIDTSGLSRAGAAAGQGYGTAADLASRYSGQLGQQAGVNYGAQQNLMGAGNQLWQTALDPQKQLQQQLQQQTQDQSRAASSSRGIGMGAESAGLENDAMRNFMLQWQNQQLSRQAQGLQGMTGAYGQAGAQGREGGQNLTGSLEMAGMNPQLLQMMGQVPYQMNVQAAGAPMNYANMFSQAQGGASGLDSNIMSQIIPYLYAGQGASGQAFGQYQTGLNNLTTGMDQLGKNWGSLSQLFSGPPTPSSGTGYGNIPGAGADYGQMFPN